MWKASITNQGFLHHEAVQSLIEFPEPLPLAV